MAKKPLDGPLYDFLMERFPDHRSVQGLLDVPGLADDIDVSYQAIYNAIHANRLSIAMAKRIISLSETIDPFDPVLPEDVLTFLFN